jgi:hypothetical protein
VDENDKFEYNDRVQGFLDGTGIIIGTVVDIDPTTEYKYLIKSFPEGFYYVFEEDELELWKETNAID